MEITKEEIKKQYEIFYKEESDYIRDKTSTDKSNANYAKIIDVDIPKMRRERLNKIYQMEDSREKNLMIQAFYWTNWQKGGFLNEQDNDLVNLGDLLYILLEKGKMKSKYIQLIIVNQENFDLYKKYINTDDYIDNEYINYYKIGELSLEQILMFLNIKNNTKLEINEELITDLTVDFVNYFSNNNLFKYKVYKNYILKNNLFCFLGITESILDKETKVGVGYGVVYSIVTNILKDKIKESQKSSTTTLTTPSTTTLTTFSTTTETTPLNLKVMKTLDNGNCFYSSVYRNAKYNNLLNKIFACIPELNSTTENEFIQKFRAYVSFNIDDKIIHMFYHLTNLFESHDTDNVALIVNKLGDINDIIIEYIEYDIFSPEYLNDFVLDIKKIIKTDKKYVGQLEVEFIKEKLEGCGIYINIFYDKSSAEQKMNEDVVSNYLYKNSLYFINIGEIHYMYIIEDKDKDKDKDEDK